MKTLTHIIEPPQPKHRHHIRWKARMLAKQGMTYREIAATVGRDARTVSDYVAFRPKKKPTEPATTAP